MASVESTEEQSPVQLLERLDRILAELDVSTEVKESELNDPDYTDQNKEYHKVTTMFDDNVNFIVSKACSVLESSPTAKSIFRLCSVGCGDGMMDKEILEGISKYFPQAKVHYVGIDTNTLSCTRAKESLGSLKNVTVEIHNRDIQLSVEDIEPCDLVIGVNMIYYVSSLKSALNNMVKLIKQKGFLILVAVPKNPFSELFCRFWFHEKKRPICLSTDVMKQLDDIGVEYTLEFIDGIVNLTQCFKDGFQQPIQKGVLNFTAQTKFERYPPLVAETCIEYLYSIAYGKPEQTLIASRPDIIIVQHK